MGGGRAAGTVRTGLVNHFQFHSTDCFVRSFSADSVEVSPWSPSATSPAAKVIKTWLLKTV